MGEPVTNQGHQWPTKLNQAEEVWAFFKQFSLTSSTAVAKKMLAASTMCETVTASYSSGVVRLKGAVEQSRVRVMDTKGRLVTGATIARDQFAFAGKPGGVYLVMVSGMERPMALRIVVP